MGAKPIFASERTAAKLLDMKPDEFRQLVNQGALPPPYRLQGTDIERWEWAELKCIALGVAMLKETDEEWDDLLSDYEPDRPSRYVPPAVRAAVYHRDGEVCAYCGTTDGPFHLDHIEPVARGGESTEENLTVACVPCNMSKRDKTLAEWKGGT